MYLYYISIYALYIDCQTNMNIIKFTFFLFSICVRLFLQKVNDKVTEMISEFMLFLH